MKINKLKSKAFSTKAIHAGQEPDPSTGAVMTPITLSSTYAQKAPGKHKGYEYSRVSNPTRKALEHCISALEEGSFSFACASGVAASSLIFEILKPGDLLVAEEDLYGGSLRILTKILKPRGISIHLMDLSKEDNIFKIPKKAKMIWLESPTNPLMKLIDIKKVSAVAKKNKSLLVVDNTFMSPFFQKPLLLGADIVLHSATKYLSGHSDIVAGVITTHCPDLAESLAFWSKSLGPVLSPFDSYLLLRSLKTLAIRMKAHEQNALELALFLEKQKRVKKVLYPGLKSHPQHQLALKQMSGFGGMISFYLKGGKKEVFECLSRFQIFTLAESLGGVESLVEHPASMTHAASPHPPSESLIRISTGIEDVKDLKSDFLQALKSKKPFKRQENKAR
ncbi:MAG: PLP-dependent aspartate aminotransferase family protein [Bdellovibrionales bacterium]|nr:PLP-dependent aspartate aminotransferase family protein [Bdellovibrionales bacterium]